VSLELADTSAWTAARRLPDVRKAFDDRVRAREIAVCRAVVAELTMESRDAGEVSFTRDYLEGFRDLPIRRREWDRALDVLAALAERGPLHHRQVKIPDLLVAAAAEAAEVPVLHYDRHFELIAEVTGQPVRALAPLGTM
jgi:predicted nucleic acid-binding protein